MTLLIPSEKKAGEAKTGQSDRGENHGGLAFQLTADHGPNDRDPNVLDSDLRGRLFREWCFSHPKLEVILELTSVEGGSDGREHFLLRN